MKTILTSDVERAAAIIKSGGIVAFPTETVYGLGADALDPTAVEKIFAAKQRPADNPLIVHIAGIHQLDRLTYGIPPAAAALIEAFFPGPLTLILGRKLDVPTVVSAGLDTIAVRMPASAMAAEFLRLCDTPVAAPSANLSGRPSPTTWQAVVEDLDGRIDCILQGEPTEIGLESTVVDCTAAVPTLLRQGAVSLAQLQTIVPETALRLSRHDDVARSPGLKHKHYSPRAKVALIGEGSLTRPGDRSAFIGLTPVSGQFAATKLCDSAASYAGSVFEFFRECDRLELDVIYCEPVPEDGIGAALMDRLRRAAEG